MALRLNQLISLSSPKAILFSGRTRGVRFACKTVNPNALIMHINGLTGQGAYELSTVLYDRQEHVDSLKGKKLRYPMPSALCSYCLGETRIGESYQMGNVRKIKINEQ
ncbi:MAG: hypothetical protein U5L09_20740 [Bacteroidales bacterium]|nr:hypothetical protein [Bacteroidales bacterium]